MKVAFAPARICPTSASSMSTSSSICVEIARQREQHRRRHRGDDGLAGGDLAVEHDAVDRRVDRRLRRAWSCPGRPVRAQVPRPPCARARSPVDDVELLLRHRVAFFQRRCSASCVCVHLAKRRLRLRQRGLRLLQLGDELIGVDAGQDLALLHMVVEIDIELVDLARYFRADIDLVAGRKRAGCADIDGEVDRGSRAW